MKRIKLTDILLLIGSLIYTIGIHTFFKVCEPMSDTYMSCHWAGEVLKVLGITMTILTLIHLIIKDNKIKIGMNLCFYAISIIMMLIPGTIIDLCKMSDMMCHTSELYTMIFGGVLIFITSIDSYLNYHQINMEKHSRENIL